MNFSEIRRVAITALFSDDVLLEDLVLKGGNALSLVYGITTRTSLDLDFSMATDFEDLSDARERLFRVLRDRFDARGYVVFDEQLERKPPARLEGEESKQRWGGYALRFKVIERAKFDALKHQPDKLRINALVTGVKQKRTFTIDLSKYEYTEGKVEREFDEFTIYVYTPEMIVIEKLRAICQQMEAYEHRGHRSARARDFYDIYTVIKVCGMVLETKENTKLIQHIFAAKQVPLTFLPAIATEREFHRLDWPSVVDSTEGPLGPFDLYFDFVVAQVEQLKALWEE